MALVPLARKASVISEASRVIRNEAKSTSKSTIQFNVSPLSQNEIDFIQNQAQESIQQLYTRCIKSQFTCLDLKKRIHFLPTKSNHLKNSSELAYATMYASIDDILSLRDMNESIQHFSKDIFDTKLLYRILETSHENIYIRWQAIAFPLPVLSRDFCFIEIQKEFEDLNGRRTWIFTQHSIELNSCPSRQTTDGLVRGSMYSSGMVFIESDINGLLDVYMYTEMDLKGLVPSWLTRLQLRRRTLELNLLSTIIHEKHLTDRIQYQFVIFVPKNDRTHCSKCIKLFHTIRRKCNCQICGEVFCWGCTQFWKLNHRMKRVCLNCSNILHVDSNNPAFDTIYQCELDIPILRNRASTSAMRGTNYFKKTWTSFDDKRTTENESDMDWTQTITSNAAVFGETNTLEKDPLLDSNTRLTGRMKRAKSEFYVW